MPSSDWHDHNGVLHQHIGCEVVGVWDWASQTEWASIATETWQILLVVQWTPLVVQRSPGQFPTPFPWPLAGWTRIPGTCGFDSWEYSWEHCGNLRFMPCKKIGLHEKFPSIVPFGCSEPCENIFQNFVPRTFLLSSQELVQKFPGTAPGKMFLMCPGGLIQARTWIGLVSREDSSLESWMSMWFGSPHHIFAIDDGQPRRWKIRRQPYPQKSETRKPCQRIGTLTNASVTGWEQGSRDLKKSMQQI